MRNTSAVHISQRLREAIFEAAPRGTAFLHAPKAAGSSVVHAIETAHRPVIRLAELSGLHSPECACTDPICRAARRHETEGVEGIRRGGPWLLDLGHYALTAEEAADIPPGMPIVVPLRSNEQRVVSLFRFNVTQYTYGRGLRIVLTPKITLAWNPHQRAPLGNRVVWGHEHRAGILQWLRLGREMAYHVAPDGRTLLWREWAASALGEGLRGLFWYHELLPGLHSTADPRWSRLVRIPMADLEAWTLDAFGAAMPHVNRSIREQPGLDIASATAELSAAASDYTAVDREIMELLLS